MFTSLRRHLLLSSLVLMSFAVACAGSKKKGRSGETPRLAWVESPSSGSQAGEVISIPGLALKFHVPDTLYVFKECQETGHGKAGPDGKWRSVLECNPRSGGSGEEEEEGDLFGDEEESEGDGEFSAPITLYVTKKDMVINERAVASIKAKYKHEGWEVDAIDYIADYKSKPGRTGIEMRVHQSEGEEVLRFMWPVDDVMFIFEVKYPMSANRSGLSQDWQRIVWGLQFDEDGPLYPDA